jgi:hypothetical protein
VLLPEALIAHVRYLFDAERVVTVCIARARGVEKIKRKPKPDLLVRGQVDGAPKALGRRVLGVGLPAHLLCLFKAERVYVKRRVSVDELLEDDRGPRIGDLFRKVVTDLPGTVQRPARRDLFDVDDIVHRVTGWVIAQEA